MKFRGSRTEKMAKSKSRFSVEEYLEFFDSHSDKDKIQRLTNDSLRQIISMHGFKLIGGTNKKMLVEAAEGIDPVTPWRSTLGETGVMPPSASIGKEEIVAVLEELKWQECCVTSVRTLKAAKSERKPKRKSLSDLTG